MLTKHNIFDNINTEILEGDMFDKALMLFEVVNNINSKKGNCDMEKVEPIEKFCVDCVHCFIVTEEDNPNAEVDYLCKHLVKKSRVTGKYEEDDMTLCYEERYCSDKKCCGPEGKFFNNK